MKREQKKTRDLVRRPRFGACLAAISEPELYRNFAIHLLVMFPSAIVMCFIASRIDSGLGLEPFLTPPWSLISGGAMIFTGGFWVWYVYGYLFLSGGGSPGSHVDGGPSTLVDTGPYTVIRHPSVLGKLLGVAGLGLAWGSWTFELVFVPVLLLYSLLTNRYLQERYCDQRFGSQYQTYRSRVPMLLPRPSGIRRWLANQAAVGEDGPRAAGVSPPGIWMELRWYLVGLLLLIGFFAALLAGVHMLFQR